MFITVEELKTSVLNANLDVEYINPAIYEAEDVYLREILGDRLYTVLWNKKQSETLSGKYLTLVDSYIKPYLTYKVQSILVVPINFKMRNAGVVNQYDQGFSTTTVKDTAYLAEHYDGRAEFYANRLTTYLKQNASDLPEYGYSADNITNPTDSQNVTTLYLGGTRKKCNYIPTGSGGGGTADAVEWDDILNKPEFATVATTGDYDDLTDKPTIPTKTSDLTNDSGFTTFSGDYNDLTNKPTIPTVPTNVSAFTNDAGYLTQHQSLAGYATENWVQQQGYSTFDGDYNSLTNKPNFATVATTGSYNDLTDKPTITQVQADWQQNDSTQPDYIKNKPSMPSAQVQADWNQTNTSEVDYIKNKPTIPTKTSDLTNDSGFTTFSGSYNDLSDIPSYFSYINENGSKNGVILYGETQFGQITADIAGGIQCNFKVDKSVSTRLYTDYIITGETSGGRTELVVSGNDGNNVYGKIAKDGIYEGSTKLEAKYLQINDLPTNVSAFTNDAGYLTQHQSLAGYATENWVQQQGYSTFDGDYNNLTNKPTIPTVNNGSLTIQKNGTTIATFTANDSSTKTANITVPTDETDLGLTTETWTFTVDDGQGGTTTVTKQVVIK